MIKRISYVVAAIIFTACGKVETAQIAENTFVYKDKVYKMVDNEITEVADLSSKNIRKFEVLKPKQKSLGNCSLSFVKEGASANIDALYRGNNLYYKLTISGFNDLKDKYAQGTFSVEFQDEFGFILHSTPVMTNELIGMIGDDGEINVYQYNGKTEMSTDINSEIKGFTVGSSVSKK